MHTYGPSGAHACRDNDFGDSGITVNREREREREREMRLTKMCH
jgi:hypothetical protein